MRRQFNAIKTWFMFRLKLCIQPNDICELTLAGYRTVTRSGVTWAIKFLEMSPRLLIENIESFFGHYMVLDREFNDILILFDEWRYDLKLIVTYYWLKTRRLFPIYILTITFRKNNGEGAFLSNDSILCKIFRYFWFLSMFDLLQIL